MKTIKAIFITFLSLLILVCCVSCNKVTTKPNNNEKEQVISSLIELDANQTLVIGGSTFKNMQRETKVEQYLNVQKTYGLRLYRTTLDGEYTVNNCTLPYIKGDNNYYYYWANYNNYNTTDSILLGNLETTIKTSYRYLLYSESSIFLETKTQTTTKYDYDPRVINITATGIYYLNGYFSTYETESLDNVIGLPEELVNQANLILSNFTYVVQAQKEKTVTNYNTQTYNNTYFYLTEGKLDNQAK